MKKTLLSFFMLIPIIIMIMSGCSSLTVTKTGTVTPSTSSPSLEQQLAISYVQVYLIDLTGTTGTHLISNFSTLAAQFKWSVTPKQNLSQTYLVSASYRYGPPTDTIGTWLVDTSNFNVSPADSKAQNAEEQVKLSKNTIALVPISGNTK